MGGNLAVVDAQGEILWDANLSGTLPHTATIGDVDGDGQVGVREHRNFNNLFSLAWFISLSFFKILPIAYVIVCTYCHIASSHSYCFSVSILSNFFLLIILLSRPPLRISFYYQVDIAIVAASADGTSHLWIVRGDTGKLTVYPSTHLQLFNPVCYQMLSHNLSFLFLFIILFISLHDVLIYHCLNKIDYYNIEIASKYLHFMWVNFMIMILITMITGISLEGYPMALPAGVIASASVLLVGTYLYIRFFLYRR